MIMEVKACSRDPKLELNINSTLTITALVLTSILLIFAVVTFVIVVRHSKRKNQYLFHWKLILCSMIMMVTYSMQVVNYSLTLWYCDFYKSSWWFGLPCFSFWTTIPTLLYTWHNFVIVDKLANQSSWSCLSPFHFALVTTACASVIITSGLEMLFWAKLYQIQTLAKFSTYIEKINRSHDASLICAAIGTILSAGYLGGTILRST
jgi:hypothetical protein